MDRTKQYHNTPGSVTSTYVIVTTLSHETGHVTSTDRHLCRRVRGSSPPSSVAHSAASLFWTTFVWPIRTHPSVSLPPRCRHHLHPTLKACISLHLCWYLWLCWHLWLCRYLRPWSAWVTCPLCLFLHAGDQSFLPRTKTDLSQIWNRMRP